MSNQKTTIWGYEAKLVVKVDGRWIEVLKAFKQPHPHLSPQLDFEAVLHAARDAEQRATPTYREVNLDA